MPKYSEVIVKEKEHVSHQAWWIFYNFGHAAGFHTWIPTDEEMDWLSEKYPDTLINTTVHVGNLLAKWKLKVNASIAQVYLNCAKFAKFQ
jgi:phenol hydroxylase P3 protein